MKTENETQSPEELSTIVQTLDGSRYKYVTGSNDKWTYSFNRCSSDVADFFITGYTQSLSTAVTFEREADDGSFDSYDVIISLPQWQDDNLTVSGKIYKDFNCEVFEA